MRHYSLEDWADYGQGVAPEDLKKAMQKHLDSGCKKCSRTLALWKEVRKVGEEEARYMPPEPIVRQVKGMMAMHLPKAGVRLIFDSAREPLPAGFRAVGVSAQHLLYQAGPILLDLQVERVGQGEQISVIGQVLSQAKPKEGLSNVRVVVSSGDNSVAETRTNKFGEFQLEFKELAGLRLTVETGSGKSLEISLRIMEL